MQVLTLAILFCAGQVRDSNAAGLTSLRFCVSRNQSSWNVSNRCSLKALAAQARVLVLPTLEIGYHITPNSKLVWQYINLRYFSLWVIRCQAIYDLRYHQNGVLHLHITKEVKRAGKNRWSLCLAKIQALIRDTNAGNGSAARSGTSKGKEIKVSFALSPLQLAIAFAWPLASMSPRAASRKITWLAAHRISSAEPSKSKNTQQVSKAKWFIQVESSKQLNAPCS